MQDGRWQCRPPFDAFCMFYGMLSQCHSNIRLLCWCSNSTLLLSIDLKACLCHYLHFANGKPETWGGIVAGSDQLTMLKPGMQSFFFESPMWCSPWCYSISFWSLFLRCYQVLAGCPLSLMDLQLSYSRLDLNKELGRDMWLTHWFTMFTLSGWSPFKNRNTPSFLASPSSTETRDNFYFIKKRNQWTWPLPKIPPKLLI